ncbi:MAG: ChaN family lipoprotein [Betaproteobacteria bacterium]
MSRARMVTRDALLRDLASARFILLGEVHDNPEHHRLQADVLRAMVAQGRRPALAMEQLDREFQPAIDAALARPRASADAIATAGGFDRTGWTWDFYAPLLAVATDERLPVLAINLSRNRTRDVARQGFASLGASAVAGLALDRTWAPARQAIMDREIADGHCGKLPAAALPRMVDVQRARDATMADALIGLAGAGAVVIAGAGHVRNDIGIPIYMASRLPGQRLVSVGFVEVDAGRNAVSDHVRPPASTMPFDYVWFTSTADREDPCAGFAMPIRP